ncbi:MAG: hypothetical protein HWN51_04605, partial [Desulfobacterales bacterium]|nr:hypothetical protein [Desulfobacterales bacterium]
MRKKGFYILVIIVAASAGLLLGKDYSGTGDPFRECAAASVAGRKFFPEKEILPSMRRMLAAQVLVFRCQDYEQVEKCIMDLKAAG